MGRIGGQSGETVGEPGLRVDILHFGADDQAIENGSALSAAIGTAEQPKDHLFAGSDGGGHRWSVLCSLIET